MKRGLAYAQTLKGDVCRPFASDGIVAVAVGDKISHWFDPEDARALGRDLLRFADEAERVAFDGVKLAEGTLEARPVALGVDRDRMTEPHPQRPRNSRVQRRGTSS